VNLRRLNSGDLPVETKALAKALLGCILVRTGEDGTTSGRIVETEAYLPNDPACHAFFGKSLRNATLFGPPHLAYVYQIYGTSFCFNLSSEPEGTGAGVLVRALEPIEGLALMARRRGVERSYDLCRGPGRLCRALAIDRSFEGTDLFSDPVLWLARDDWAPARVRRSPRIGITRAADHRLRFYLAGSPYLSGPARLSPA
jgi:DNA-3-methyladenine glycosylase